MTNLSLRVTNEYLKDLELCGRLMEEEKNDPVLPRGEGIMAICVECEYWGEYLNCTNPDLPVTSFVYGTRDPKILNPEGNCKGFKAKPKPELTYESKEDEELAKTD